MSPTFHATILPCSVNRTAKSHHHNPALRISHFCILGLEFSHSTWTRSPSGCDGALRPLHHVPPRSPRPGPPGLDRVREARPASVAGPESNARHLPGAFCRRRGVLRVWRSGKCCEFGRFGKGQIHADFDDITGKFGMRELYNLITSPEWIKREIKVRPPS
eukprot:1885489-Rhodomonas_salina.4